MENREIKENLEATEVDAQELEEMDAPIDDGTVSAILFRDRCVGRRDHHLTVVFRNRPPGEPGGRFLCKNGAPRWPRGPFLVNTRAEFGRMEQEAGR